jgi:hypothetical protein
MKTTMEVKEEPLETGPNIARKIDVDPATMRRYHREGCPGYILGPRMTRFKMSEVLTWLAQRKSK